MKLKPYPKYKDSGVPWLGDVPEHWEQRRVGTVFKLGRGRVIDKGEMIDNPGLYPVYSSQSKNNGIMGYLNSYDFDGEFITWTTDGAYAGTVFRRRGKFNCTNVCGTLYPRIKEIDLTYVHYSLGLGTSYFVRYDINPKLMNNVMARIPFPFPPFNEQQQISRYLDWKTAQINKFIRNKRRLIQLLKEQKQNIINQAVTKGINPNVEMKDSGVEWLGQIPKHWEVRRIKSLSQVKRGASPRPIVADKYFDQNGEYAWVRISDVSANGKYLEYTTQQLSELGKSKSVPLQPESIFLSIAGSVGKPTITKIKCCIHDGFVYFPDYKYNVEYLYYVFLSGNLWNGLGKLGTQLNLNTGTVGAVSIGLPPNSEQQEIVTYIEKETALIDKTISRTEREIELIQEYRSRLISDVVTGKLDVRGIEIPDFEPVEAYLEVEGDEELEDEEIDEDE